MFRDSFLSRLLSCQRLTKKVHYKTDNSIPNTYVDPGQRYFYLEKDTHKSKRQWKIRILKKRQGLWHRKKRKLRTLHLNQKVYWIVQICPGKVYWKPWTWQQKATKNGPTSKRRKRMKTTVAGGEKSVHTCRTLSKWILRLYCHCSSNRREIFHWALLSCS